MAGFSTTSHAVDAFCGPQAYDPSNYCFAVYAATAANLPNATAVYASSATGKAGWLETNGGTGLRATSTTGRAIWATASGSGGVGVTGDATGSTGIGLLAASTSYRAVSAHTTSGMAVFAEATNSTNPTVFARSHGNAAAIEGEAVAGSVGVADGVRGRSYVSNGVYGRTLTSVACGVSGENLTGGGFGVAGRTTGSGTGVYGENLSTGHAGYFIGKVHVAGIFSASAKNFRIDHPQDPANKILQHISVESDDYKTVYDGVVRLDESGRATITMPSWFEALNRDFRYQLTPIGAPASLFVQSEIQGGTFSIAGGAPNMKVSWQVTGIRKDAYANANPFQVEVQKGPDERGKFLNPEVFGAAAQRVVAMPPASKAQP